MITYYMEPLTDDIWNALSALLANETNNGEKARICNILNTNLFDSPTPLLVHRVLNIMDQTVEPILAVKIPTMPPAEIAELHDIRFRIGFELHPNTMIKTINAFTQNYPDLKDGLMDPIPFYRYFIIMLLRIHIQLKKIIPIQYRL